MLDGMTMHDFQPHVGSPFTMCVGDETVELRLIEVKGLGAKGSGRLDSH